jgi:hypothetical protein
MERSRNHRDYAINPDVFGLLNSTSNLVGWDLQDTTDNNIAQARLGGNLDSDYDAANSNVSIAQPGVGNIPYSYLYDPASNAHTNLYTASLNTFFDGDKGSMFIAFKINDATMWTDASYHVLMAIAASATEFIKFYIDNTGVLTIIRRASGTTDIWLVPGLTNSLDWHMAAITWDTSAGATGESYAYVDGAQFGAVQTGLGAWISVLSSTLTGIGADNTTQQYEINAKCAIAGVSNQALPNSFFDELYIRGGI